MWFETFLPIRFLRGINLVLQFSTFFREIEWNSWNSATLYLLSYTFFREIIYFYYFFLQFSENPPIPFHRQEFFKSEEWVVYPENSLLLKIRILDEYLVFQQLVDWDLRINNMTACNQVPVLSSNFQVCSSKIPN